MKAGGAQPFYEGQTVIAVDALPKSIIKNGLLYEVYSCEYAECKGQMFWYVGVSGQGIITHNRIRPSIFAPIIETVMKFEAIENEVYAN